MMKVVLPWNFVSLFIPLCIIVLLLGGCGHGSLPKPPASIPHKACLPFVADSETREAVSFAQNFEKWWVVSQTAMGLEEKAQAHLHLAALFLNQENPAKSSHQAYLELLKAVQLWPDLKNNIAVSSWVALLADHEALKVDFVKERVVFENDLAQARRQISSQGLEIKNLKEKIEKLKRAEMVVERKRRAFK